MPRSPIPYRSSAATKVGTLSSFTLVMAVALGCGPSQEEYDAALAHGHDLESQLHDAEASRAQLEERFTSLQAQNEELANRLRALGQNVEALEGERSKIGRASCRERV